MHKLLIRFVMWAAGWTPVGGPPQDQPRYVLISAPHTSNWDFLLLLSYCWLHDVPLRWMAKDSIFKGPFGPLFKAMGGVPIDRSTSHNMVARMVEAFQRHERIVISVPPEGTRKRVPHWKTGFYYLARGAGVPLVLSFIDGPRRRVGMGPVVWPSEDLRQDMVAIADFYRPILGIHPGKTSPVVLRSEEVADQVEKERS